MAPLLPNASPSPPFSSFSKDELVEMLAEAEAEIVALRRKLSPDGHVWSWKGDPAGLKQKIEGGKSLQFWSEAPVIDSPTETISSLLLPSPRLPIELLRAVALECDSQTLGRLTQANFTLLEIASPILYHTLRIPFDAEDDGRTSYGSELHTFANATYSPALAALLPRLSLDSVVHLHLPLIERDDHDPQEGTQADINRSMRLRARREPNSDSEEDWDSEEDSDFDEFFEHPLPPIPPISLPNLQTLHLVVCGAKEPSTKLDLSLCLDLLLTFHDSELKEVTFDNVEILADSWSTFQLDAELWNRCLVAWTELERVRFRGVAVEVGGRPLSAMDPAAATSSNKETRFEWEVSRDQHSWSHIEDFIEAFPAAVLSVEEPWNRRAGGFGVTVRTEEDKEEVQELVENWLEKESGHLIQIVVA